MKRPIILILLLALALAFGGCTGGGDASELPGYSQGLDENGFWEGVKATDYVTLGLYEGLEVPADVAAVTAEQIDSEIEYILAAYFENVEVTDRPAQLGDTVDIDYAGYLADGTQFEGGTGNIGDLVLGSGSFIAGFEDGVVGHDAGDNFSLDLSFPEEYPNNPDLAGAEVTFVVTLNKISVSVAPELSDSFVKEKLSADNGYETVAEMRASIEESLSHDNKMSYLSSIVEAFEVSSVPEFMMDYQKEQLRTFYQQYADMYGMELDEFVSGMGMGSTMEEMTETLLPELEHQAKCYLIYQAIAEDAGIKITDEDIDEQFKDMTQEDRKSIEERFGLPYIKCMLVNSKSLEHVVDSCVVSE